MSATQRSYATRKLLASLATLAGVAALAGCGGSSTPKVSAAQSGQQTPAQSGADVGGSRAQTSGSKGHRGGYQVKTAPGVQKGRDTPATSKDDLSKPSPTAFNPCRLVTLSEAQSITGGGITSRIEAPLGPTCIYARSGAKSEITVSIESLSMAQINRNMRQTQSLNVGTHKAYCGRLGSQTLYLPLASGKLLHITAPCSIAQQFAAHALTRIAA
jgi:hypothetical protein